MAEKRMFAKTVISSDVFLDMPTSARLLYYDLGMRADDDGFIDSPKSIMRLTGASDDDMRILISKKFVIPFEKGIVVIKHWKINNYIQKDRYTETQYKEEKALLELDENKAYCMQTLNSECIQSVHSLDTQKNIIQASNVEKSTCIQDGHDVYTQSRLDKSRLDKNRLDSVSSETPNQSPKPKKIQSKIDFDIYEQIYNTTCTKLPKVKKITEKRKTAIRKFLQEFTTEQFEEICKIANKLEFLTGNNKTGWKADFDFIIRPDKAVSILEGKYEGSYNPTPPPYKEKYDKSNEGGFEF
ncbi:MAG: hypothetical protein AB9836_04925 [Aminipila sp.]